MYILFELAHMLSYFLVFIISKKKKLLSIFFFFLYENKHYVRLHLLILMFLEIYLFLQGFDEGNKVGKHRDRVSGLESDIPSKDIQS